MSPRFAYLLLLFALQCLGSELTMSDSEGRLKMALQIARERNDRALVRSVEELGQAFKLKLPPDADERLRKVEQSVGIDPGGWSMAGQPLFHPTPAIQAAQRELAPKLATAMASNDASEVRAVTVAMARALGDQAGVPDGRRIGVKPLPNSIDEAAATKLFLDALATQQRVVKQLTKATPLPDQMVRLYAYVLEAVTTVQPFVKRHYPEHEAELESLANGVATILLKLQQPAGHFPFPDLRGKNIRFGDMTNKRLAEGSAKVQDGWIISSDPDGGTQFDTGLCGSALLRAGQLFDHVEWRAAGLRAADWALAQQCCANFNYNAFSVSLLAQAFTATGEEKYREAALGKFRVGVAPGQAANGRWIDPHNARTVYHIIILRALGDLSAIVTGQDRAEVEAVAKPAIKALLEEFEAMGITVEALPELTSLLALDPDNTRLQVAQKNMAASIVAKCTNGQQVKMGAQPQQLATVAKICGR